MSIIIKTTSNELFPFDSGNKYYEEVVSANKEALLSAETKLSVASSVISTGLIGARVLKQFDKLPISNQGLNVLSTVGLIASAALLIGGYSITRAQLSNLDVTPQINASTSLTQEQIAELVSRAKDAQTIKLFSQDSSRHLTYLISVLELADAASQVYFPPEERRKIVAAVKELEGIEKRAKTKEEIQRLKQKLAVHTRRFIVDEHENGENPNVGPSAIIKWDKKRKEKDVKFSYCADLLEKIDSQLKENEEKADIGPWAYDLLGVPVRLILPQLRVHSVPQIGAKSGGLRRSPTFNNLDQ